MLTRKPCSAVARKLRDAAAVIFGFKFADNIHYKFKSSQASKVRLQSSKRTVHCVVKTDFAKSRIL